MRNGERSEPDRRRGQCRVAMGALFKVVLVIVPQVECDGTLVDDRAVAETRADRIDAAPVILPLYMPNTALT